MNQTVTHPEFPGFSLPGAPVFNGARGSSMFAGNMYDPLVVLDLAMVFGCRLWGHDEIAAPEVGASPGVGDLYTHEWRRHASGMLADAVSAQLREDSAEWRSLVLHTGSEAVETALKTALRATGRIRLHAFEGGYHGTFGLALAVTHRPEFREPWEAQYGGTVSWSKWGEVPKLNEDVAAVIVEPWQGRAGVIAPPPRFHAELRAECDRVGAALIVDAVLCGAGRTGSEIAACLSDLRPDIVCLGKAIGCGAVASAVVARESLADAAWARGPVEPAHTSTTLGDPVACAGIICALERLNDRRSELEESYSTWRNTVRKIKENSPSVSTRGLGMLWAFDTGRVGGGLQVASRMLTEHRILVVPSGVDSSSITIYPSIAVSDYEIERFIEAMSAELNSAYETA